MMTEFKLLQDEWIQIAPLGDHPHAQGIQRIDSTAIANMARRFNSVVARVGRLFSGAPLFEGHPDTDPERYPSTESFGWIMALEDRGAEGLWGRMKWTAEGLNLVKSGNYKFVSPVWRAAEIGNENGRTVYRPESLLSLGLTNLPNLPLPPLANEKKATMKTLTEILGLNEAASGDEICAAAETLSNARKTEGERVATLENELAQAKERLGIAHAARIELMLANAIHAQQITLAEKDGWKADLERDFASAEALLAKRTAGTAALQLNTESKTRALGNQKPLYATEADRRIAIHSFMDLKKKEGARHDDAWALAKVELAAVFEQMEKK